jgi:dihydroorotase
MKILIKGGRVVDPAGGRDAVLDVLIDNGKISRVAECIQEQADSVIPASGKFVAPRIVDMHVHLREPGREIKRRWPRGPPRQPRAG